MIITHFSENSHRENNPNFYSFFQAFDLITSPKQGALPLTNCSNNEHLFAKVLKGGEIAPNSKFALLPLRGKRTESFEKATPRNPASSNNPAFPLLFSSEKVPYFS